MVLKWEFTPYDIYFGALIFVTLKMKTFWFIGGITLMMFLKEIQFFTFTALKSKCKYMGICGIGIFSASDFICPSIFLPTFALPSLTLPPFLSFFSFLI